jgi:hypothetical protein
MKSASRYVLLVISVVTLVGCSATATPVQPATHVPQPTAAGKAPALSPFAPAPATSAATLPENAASAPQADPFDLISQESLFTFMEELTAIQAFSGWRNSASEGEAEALDYVAQQLGELGYVRDLGLELERQSFRVFVGTELWETRLRLSVDGQEVEVPADGLRGPRDDLVQALRFDSDGKFNDAERDPVEVEGPVVPIRSTDEVQRLSRQDLQGKVVFLDYATIDRAVEDRWQAMGLVSDLLDRGLAGLVLVTSFSNQPGESHGSFVGDSSVLDWVETEPVPPILYARLEDFLAAGIEDWDDMERIETARLTWDSDVFAPATSGNLVAHIPGADPSQAMILGAHIDSPNAPGALDDGSGSVILMEVARVLDAAQVQPPIDLYLVWFGSEELGLYGSSHFVATHQELLDRTRAMLQIDMLSRPLDGMTADLRLVTWSYGRLGDGRLLWPDSLSQAAARRGVQVIAEDVYYVYSDNSAFAGFDVPQADLIYEPAVAPNLSVHYASHVHDPYDTVDLAREMGDVLEQMARVALAAAVDSGQDHSSLRVTPQADRRALFVASHTEAVQMTPSGFTELGMALSLGGFDVDLIPYGQAVAPADVEGTDLVVVLPVVDYPSPEGDPDAYDEAWTEEEIAVLEEYVARGGLIVLTNSARRLKYGNSGLDPNEDWRDTNALASRFGITYQEGTIGDNQAQIEGEHLLVQGMTTLERGPDNGVPFSLGEATQGQVLAWVGGHLVVALVDYGDAGGQVLILADTGILAAGRSEPYNLPFWQNLARFARQRAPDG